MTEEGQVGHPMDPVEMVHAARGIASTTRAFYVALKDEGFSKDEAMKLTHTWLFGMAGGKQV